MNSQHKENTNNITESVSVKKPYTSPNLTKYGTMKELMATSEVQNVADVRGLLASVIVCW